MADLLAILSNAANSMGAQRALSSTAANNIANANTPGYSRQIAELEQTAPGELQGTSWLGRGATLGSVTQARDRYVEAQVPRAMADAARSSAESDALSSLHVLDPDQDGSIPSVVGDFYAALRSLSQNPGDPALRATALGAAGTLASTFQRASSDVQGARSGLDDRIDGWVDQVNSAAKAVADANAAIAQARASGGEPNDLLDLRQKQLDTLAQLTGAAQVAQGDGSVNVVLPGGGALVSGTRAGVLSTVVDASNSGLHAFQLAAPDGSAPAAVPTSSLGGSIGGALDARDGSLKTVLTGLDQLASDLAGAVNGVHAAGYGLDGVTGRPLFAAAGGGPITASSLRVAITDPRQLATASSSAAASGDAGNALALVGTEDQPLSGGKDAQATLSAMTSTFGADAQRAQAYPAQDGALRDQVLQMRESYSGVSIDDELIQMQRAQRGYEALAKVIQTADEMTQTLINLR